MVSSVASLAGWARCGELSDREKGGANLTFSKTAGVFKVLNNGPFARWA